MVRFIDHTVYSRHRLSFSLVNRQRHPDAAPMAAMR